MVKCTDCKNCNGPTQFYDTDTDEWYNMYNCEFVGFLTETEAKADIPCDGYEQNMDDDN